MILEYYVLPSSCVPCVRCTVMKLGAFRITDSVTYLQTYLADKHDSDSEVMCLLPKCIEINLSGFVC